MKNSPYLDRPTRSEAVIKAIQAAKEIQHRLDRLEKIEPIYQELLDALDQISRLSAKGPHTSAKAGFEAALGTLTQARFIAMDAMKKAAP